MADENTRPSPDNVRERRIEANLPVEERQQPDPALQLTTGRLGAVGWTIFVVVAILILTAVLWGLNGPNETPARSQTSAASNAAAPNTSPAPTPTAPANGPGAKP